MFYMDAAMHSLPFLALAFVLVIGTAALGIVILFVIDRMQTGDAVRGDYEPRQMRRHHVRIVQDSGLSLPLSEVVKRYSAATTT